MTEERKFRRKFNRAAGAEDAALPDPQPADPGQNAVTAAQKALLEQAQQQRAQERAAAEQAALAQQQAARQQEAKRLAAAKLKAQAQARQEAEVAARLAAEKKVEAQQKAERAARAKAAVARHQAAKAKQAEEARLLAEEQLRLEQEARAAEEQLRVQAMQHAEAEQAEKIRKIQAAQLAEAQRKAKQDALRAQQARKMAEAKAQAEAEAHAAAKAEAQAKADAKARADAQAAAQAQADAQAKAKAEAEALAAAKAKVLAKKKALALAKAKAEAQAKAELQAQAEAQLHAAAEATQLADPAPIAAPEPLASAAIVAPEHAWDRLAEFSLDAAALTQNKIITATRDDPAHAAFDVLRTRLLQALGQNGWNRVAITSPGKNCGKTFTAANLAISLSRQENCRTLLMDCDMRRPSLHKVLGASPVSAMGDLLRGDVAPEKHLLRPGENTIRAGQNIAFGFNAQIEPYASELLQDPSTAETLEQIEDAFEPDVMLFDLPPALFYDDVIAFRPQFDGVLLVIGGGETTEKEIKEVERRLGEETPLLGIVLNKAEGTETERYRY